MLPTVIRRSLCSLLLLVGSVGGSTALSTEPDICDQPEPCFQAAALPKERLGKVWSKEQLLTLKLERLQRLIERFPDTIWAKIRSTCLRKSARLELLLQT